jgi:hypothetical protein
MHNSLSESAAEEVESEGEGQHEQRRRHRESEPRGEAARPSRAEQPEGKADLTAGWARHGLGDSNDFCKGSLVAPSAALNELGMKISDMSDRTAKRQAPETQESAKNFACAANWWRWVGHTFSDSAALPRFGNGTLRRPK